MKDESILTADKPAQGVLRDSPGVIVFPPVLTLATLLLGILAGVLWKWPLLPASVPALPRRIAGAFVLVLAGALMAWARNTMVRTGTNVHPGQPALAIVTAGPFRFTRNPLYLGNLLIYLAFTLILNSTWLLVLFVPMVLVFRWGIIHREERYLEAKFGEVYLNYKTRVRRWL